RRAALGVVVRGDRGAARAGGPHGPAGVGPLRGRRRHPHHRRVPRDRMAGGGPMISPDARTAGTGTATSGPVTLINSFRVPVERDDDFHALWETTSHYFTRQPGFVSLRLHRAVSDDATYRWVNVARWDSEGAFCAAHATEEFRAVV